MIKTSSLRIARLSLEGFRGVNKRVELDLNKKTAIIYGENGAGKSSLLQSIEWGLYGNLPYMRGDEFEREDAVVNQFHPGKTSRVQLNLENGVSYSVLREKMKGETSTGMTQLTFKSDSERYQGGEAERKLIETVGLSQDDFYATVYMHQDAVKTLVSGSPEERSEVIDRLMGMHLLRDLSKAIPLRQLRERQVMLEKMKGEIEASINSEKFEEEKQNLEEFKKTLIEQGTPPEEYTLSKLAEILKELKTTLTDLAFPLGVNISVPEEPQIEVEGLQGYSSTLLNTTLKVEESLSREFETEKAELDRVMTLRERYIENLDSLASYDIDRFEDLSASKRQLENQIKILEPRITEIKRMKTGLERASLNLRQLDAERKRVEKDIKVLEDRLGGGEEEAEKELSTIKTTISELELSINRSQIYNQILVLGTEYLSKFKSDTCPICKVSASTPGLVDHLRGELSHLLDDDSILNYPERIKKFQDEKKRFEEGLSEHQTLKEKLKQNLRDYEDQWNETDELKALKSSGIEQLETEITKLSEEITALESDLIEIKSEFHQLEKQGSLMKSLFTNFEKLKSSIKSVLPEWNETQGLNLLDKKITNLSNKTDELKQQDLMLKDTKDKLLNLTQIISYHLKRDKLVRLEGGLPQIQRKLDELNLKLQKLSDLEESLTDIHNSIVQEKKNCFNKVLEEVQGSIRSYYEKILGHSYYQQLEIELETSPDGNHTYWIKGRGAQDSTYVKTRFSEAQLNATALAVFMAMVKHSTHHLDFTVYDDPTQSMDQTHKEALARLLCQEMGDRQLVIATQDKEFYKLLKKYVRGDYAKFYNMESWSVKGPLMTVQSSVKSLLSLF